MIDNNHPITPPPELVQQWLGDYFVCTVNSASPSEKFLATQAARWGADQEMEACCECLIDWDWDEGWSDKLRATRRPKPLSLKEQALKLLDSNSPYLDDTAIDIIRRALVEQQ